MKACLGLAIMVGSMALTVFSQTAIENVVPFPDLLKRQVSLKPELKGVHPRLFFTADEIPALREKAKGQGRDLWLETLKDIQTLKRPVPDPKNPDLYKSGLEGKLSSVTQYGLAFQIAETSFAYVIEGDEKYLDAAKKWTLAACAMPIWGYTYDKPNVDLPPAHLLYAVAFAYDSLYDKLTANERATIRQKLLVQGRLMYDYFKYKPGKKYTYSQNHTWIPITGLAIAAYALMDEEPEAAQWATLARAIYDRTMLTFGTDGYYYESFHYFGFAFRWAIRYFDVHLKATGENLYEPMREKFAGMKYFAMHSILPDRENAFDFGDIGDGALNRNGASKRERLYAEYSIIFRLAGIYHDSQAQAVGDFLRTETRLGDREPMWAFINRDASLKPSSLAEIPLQYHFKDNDTVYWRSDWTKNATAFAFRCSPPEGHHAAELASKLPDWRENTGHAHPDANSFIIFANGKYLTGDTGYLGIKQTDDHNTVLVDGRGQANDGVYEMFKGVSNAKLDQLRLTNVQMGPDFFFAKGEAASGYYDDLGLKKFTRSFIYIAPDHFIVRDELETDTPRKFTFMLNADREIKADGNAFDLTNVDSLLRVLSLSPASVKGEVVPQMIQARGLPGSVDKGDTEQRGVQLRETTESTAKTTLIHILLPYKLGDSASLPKVSLLGSEIRLDWPGGDRETVDLTGEKKTLAVVARHDAKGTTKRFVWSDTNDGLLVGQVGSSIDLGETGKNK